MKEVYLLRHTYFWSKKKVLPIQSKIMRTLGTVVGNLKEEVEVRVREGPG